MKFTSGILLSALAALPAANAVHFIFGGSRPIVKTRLDPIVNPGTVSTHVHSVAGASGFGSTYDYDKLTQSKCTTIVVPQDKSNYWTPILYHYNKANGSFTAMPNSFNIYYLVRGTDSGDKVVAPPKGLRMLAGDPNRRTYNASNFADQAVSYVCLDYSGSHNGDPDWAERPDFFPHNCPNGMRAQVFFPSCWDGKNLDSPDHKSHMAYPVENFNNGHCPPSHPVHIVSIFYEMIISVDQYSYDGPGTWIWANGDDSGLGMHGDFTMGWTDINLLQSAIDDCPNAQGNVADCPHLAAVMDQNAANACRYEGEIVDEDIGDSHPIPALPGCNPIWHGTGPKPTCDGSNSTPGLVNAQQQLLAGWTEIGCIAEGTNGRALTGASTVDPAMTKNKCASFCASKGFQYAGIEWSQECYCGNTFSNGASKNTVDASQCSNACGGDQYSTCGGPQRLTLLFNGNPGASPASSASASSSAAVHTLSSVAAVPSVSVSSVASQVSSSAAPIPSKSAVVTVSSVAPSVSAAPPKSSAASPVTSQPSGATTTQVLIGLPSSSASPSSASPSPSSAPTAPSNNGTSSVPLPAGWTAAGCATDSSHRTLNARAMTSESLTVAQCLNFCTKEGFSMAGMEYGRECYCGNSFQNNEGKPLPDSSCYMPCTGQKDAKCGGDWALSVYTKTPAPAHKRSTKAKHFGRHHVHNTF